MMIIRKPDPMWLRLCSDAGFHEFIRGYLQLLEEDLKQVTVKNQRGKSKHSYFTCGQDHDRRNPNWKPFRLLVQYCRKQGLDDFEAQEMIEDNRCAAGLQSSLLTTLKLLNGLLILWPETAFATETGVGEGGVPKVVSGLAVLSGV